MIEKYASSAERNTNDSFLARYLSANRSKRVEFIVSQPLANIYETRDSNAANGLAFICLIKSIASDETVTKLLLTTGSLETPKKFLGSAQKNRVGRVTLNKVLFFLA